MDTEQCIVCGQTDDVDNNIYLHSFPKMTKRALEWWKILFSTEKTPKGDFLKKICSRHFPRFAFISDDNNSQLCKNAIPIMLQHQVLNKKRNVPPGEMYPIFQQCKKRKRIASTEESTIHAAHAESQQGNTIDAAIDAVVAVTHAESQGESNIDSAIDAVIAVAHAKSQQESNIYAAINSVIAFTHAGLQRQSNLDAAIDAVIAVAHAESQLPEGPQPPLATRIERWQNKWKLCSDRFKNTFIDNDYGLECSICDRLWFRNDLTKVKANHIEAIVNWHIANNKNLGEEEIEYMSQQYVMCSTCKQSLSRNKMPKLAKVNGFTYPDIPADLPELDPVSERLISPCLPFMQVRRLRYDFSYGIIGQVINLPVDVPTIVDCLPRLLDDDQAVNVNIQRNLLHKSVYLSSYLKKRTVKSWLLTLQKSTLYQLYNIRVDLNRLNIQLAEDQHQTEDVDIEEIYPERIPESDVLTARQHTMIWNEDHCLNIAPDHRAVPLNIIYDRHAEELSFPSVYFGEPRRYSSNISVTPYMIASSEIRRRDRRGATPQKILYMAMRILRLRMVDGIQQTFRSVMSTEQVTRHMLKDKEFLSKCLEKNVCFLKSVPNSVQYWSARKKDLFAMIRQLGKPTAFLTLSANEIHWPSFLNLLNVLSKRYPAMDAELMNRAQRCTLVSEDPATCCIYFHKLVDCLMNMLRLSYASNPFGQFKVLDYFIRIEFQHRGSPHAHILLWLDHDPREAVSENMPKTIALLESLVSVSSEDVPDDAIYANQVHKHTLTCSKGGETSCRFGIPYWPMQSTCVLLPMPKSDGRRNDLQRKAKQLKQTLEQRTFTSFDDFIGKNGLTVASYLDIIRASLHRPTLMFKREIKEIYTNTFNPWIAGVLKSNTELQFILDEYSCAAYVVEYINKSARGMGNLHLELIKLMEQHPERDYTGQLKALGIKLLNAVEMSAQEAAWYLLGQPMSKASRDVVYVPTTWPTERQNSRKQNKHMELENIGEDSTDVWTKDVIQRYEERPVELENIYLVEFVAWYVEKRDYSKEEIVDDANNEEVIADNIEAGQTCVDELKKYRKRANARIIRYRNYDLNDIHNYKREMVTLYLPFRDEKVDILDRHIFLDLYDSNEPLIMDRRRLYESNIDIGKVMAEIQALCILNETINAEIPDEETRNMCVDQLLGADGNENMDDINLIADKRTSVMSKQEYNNLMRKTNAEQREIVLEVIDRLHDPNSQQLQVFFTGPAGSGKTFTLKLIMETYNRFSQEHNSLRNPYVACASTGKAAVALDGTTVHSAFRLCMSKKTTLSRDVLHGYRNMFVGVKCIIVDEISMLSYNVLQSINEGLQQITAVFDKPFGGINVFMCGDLRQLQPVRATPCYSTPSNHIESTPNTSAELYDDDDEFIPPKIQATTSVERGRAFRGRPKSSAENSKAYRDRKRAKKRDKVPPVLPITSITPITSYCALLREERWRRIWKKTNDRFRVRFTENEFGTECSICDRLWFRIDVRKVTEKDVQTIIKWYEDNNKQLTPDKIEDIRTHYEVCIVCHKALTIPKGRHSCHMPRLAKVYGFVYPEKPEGLPELDPVTERLIAPRLPFKQVRRLRNESGHGTVGQVLNVPCNDSEMVDCLPRLLEDDQTINVDIKRNVAQSSTNLSGYVNKTAIEMWLTELQKSTLYRRHKIKIDLSRLDSLATDDKPQSEQEENINIEEIHPEAVPETEVLAARQHTMLLDEDDCISDTNEDEELLFPGVYFGEPRSFNLDFPVTAYMVARSEIRRRDRRGATPQKVLYDALKLIRLRIVDGIQHISRSVNATENDTSSKGEDKDLLDYCYSTQHSLLKSVPNSVQYWSARKQDLLAMIRQLGKPTVSLTLNANEMRWPSFLNILNRLSKRFPGVDAESMSWSQRCTLVSADPVVCAIYFHKLVDTLINLLHLPYVGSNPFGPFRILDYFTRFDFLHHGSPRAHVLLWLNRDPKEPVCEHMPKTVDLVETICSVSCDDVPNNSIYAQQVHEHTSGCYERGETSCRFRLPHWPMTRTRVLLPIPEWDSRRNTLEAAAKQVYENLEKRTYTNIEEFLLENGLDTHEYLDIIRSTLSRPKILFKRDMTQIYTNTFNPWLAGVLNSNVELQFLLDEYSYEADVDEYVNHAARGRGNLHSELIKLMENHPEGDRSGQLKAMGAKLLKSVEMSAQEAAWYLLDQPMSEASRQVLYIPTVRPSQRQIGQNVVQRYEGRPQELEKVYLAEFVALYARKRDCPDKEEAAENDNLDKAELDDDKDTRYLRRARAQFIRYHQYEPDDTRNYEREMVLLYVPFRNERSEILKKEKFLNLYTENEQLIKQRRRLFEWNVSEDEEMLNEPVAQSGDKGSENAADGNPIAVAINISMNRQRDSNSSPLPQSTQFPGNDAASTSSLNALDEKLLDNGSENAAIRNLSTGAIKITTILPRDSDISPMSPSCSSQSQPRFQLRPLLLSGKPSPYLLTQRDSKDPKATNINIEMLKLPNKSSSNHSLDEPKQKKNANVYNSKRGKKEDNCDIYGRLIAQKLKRYSGIMRYRMMHKIDGLLLGYHHDAAIE